MDHAEIRSVLVLVNAIPDSGSVPVADGLTIVRRLSDLGPKAVQPLVQYAEQAMMTAQDHPCATNDAYAIYSLARLVVEMEALIRFKNDTYVRIADRRRPASLCSPVSQDAS